jgi:SAM-dependent methyltransferase
MREISISFDRIADRYDETRTFPAGVAARIVDAIGPFAPKPGPILDVGVGTGRLAAPLRSGGHEVVGVDVSDRMLRRARGKGLDDLLLADARMLPFPDGSFGCSVSVHVTHLIRDWMTALAEIGRVTDGWYASVATDRQGCEVNEVQMAYEKACAESGHEVGHPGVRERELTDLVKPSDVIEVATCAESVPAEDVIERYRSRVYSDLWDVPDMVHEQAMVRLEERFGPVSRLERREGITLVVWEAAAIREYAANARVAGRQD